MDNIVAESPDADVSSLDFTLPQSAQYVTDRRHVNYFCQGSNVYNSNSGNKNIRFYISGEDNTYLDLSSVRLFANLQNTDPTRSHFLRPLAPLHGFISRYRCTIGGQLCQDVVEYNRHCELYSSFKSQDARDMDDIEMNANPRWDDDWRHTYANGLDEMLKAKTTGDTDAAGPDPPRGAVSVNTAGDHNAWGDLDERYTRHSLAGIPGGTSSYMRLGHKPVCGIMESGYYIPLRHAPVELEFTIVSDEHIPVVSPVDATAQASYIDNNGFYFTTGDTSTKWELNNVQIRAEVCTLDNTVNNKITGHILQGQSIKLVFPMYHTLTQTFNTTSEINMNIVKSSTKLTGAFITLYRAPRGSGINPIPNEYSKDYYIYILLQSDD